MTGKIVQSDLPKGYTIIVGPDEREYIVPDFIIPSLEQAFAAQRAKSSINITDASGIDPSAKKVQIYTALGNKLHTIPPEQPLTEKERLTLHAEVCGLQDQLGVAYEDAAHRLYLVEVERLQMANSQWRSLWALDKRVKKSLQFLAKRHSVDLREHESGSSTK